MSFDVNTAAVLRTFHAQSLDIDLGVTKEEGQIGAGDQGIMFGYACNQTKEFMPLPIQLAHHLQNGSLRYANLRPSVSRAGRQDAGHPADRDGRPVRADYIVIAASHTPDVATRNGRYTTEEAKQEIIAKVVRPVVSDLIDERTKIPTGPASSWSAVRSAKLGRKKLSVDIENGSRRMRRGRLPIVTSMSVVPAIGRCQA